MYDIIPSDYFTLLSYAPDYQINNNITLTARIFDVAYLRSILHPSIVLINTGLPASLSRVILAVLLSTFESVAVPPAIAAVSWEVVVSDIRPVPCDEEDILVSTADAAISLYEDTPLRLLDIDEYSIGVLVGNYLTT